MFLLCIVYSKSFCVVTPSNRERSLENDVPDYESFHLRLACWSGHDDRKVIWISYGDRGPPTIWGDNLSKLLDAAACLGSFFSSPSLKRLCLPENLMKTFAGKIFCQHSVACRIFNLRELGRPMTKTTQVANQSVMLQNVCRSSCEWFWKFEIFSKALFTIVHILLKALTQAQCSGFNEIMLTLDKDIVNDDLW